MTSLTIAIPTYHRPDALLRLLGLLSNSLQKLSDPGCVNVMVRDNSANDITERLLAASAFAGCTWLDYKRNASNLGFDRNVLNLFAEAQGDYVWFIGDDDILYEGSIQKVLDLIGKQPDILHLPFRQPQGLTKPQYQESPEVVHWNNLKEAVQQVVRYIKITSFVLRRRGISVDLSRLSHDYGHSGWMHLVLAFEVLGQSPKIDSVTHAHFFAGSLDNEWKTVNWTPEASLLVRKLEQHPLIVKHELQPEIQKFEEAMYLGGIQMTLLVTTGRMSTDLPSATYAAFGAAYPFQAYLLGKPWWLLKFLVIKFRAGALFRGFFHLVAKIKG